MGRSGRDGLAGRELGHRRETAVEAELFLGHAEGEAISWVK